MIHRTRIAEYSLLIVQGSLTIFTHRIRPKNYFINKFNLLSVITSIGLQ